MERDGEKKHDTGGDVGIVGDAWMMPLKQVDY
jgi:hypothetical protein